VTTRGKYKKIGGTTNYEHSVETQTIAPRVIPPFSLCDLTCHAKVNFPTLLELKDIFNTDDLGDNSSTPMV